MNLQPMTSTERRAVMSLSSIMALRMLGLFMILPVFALYARQLEGSTPFLIGIAMGIYGLSQAIFQIPFGLLSDRIGRKPVIAAGLLLFAAGSLLAAKTENMMIMILARCLQGTGAIGGTLLAMIADLTQEEHRTQSMAIAGITIGVSFSIAMLIGPILIAWMPIKDLFLIAFFLSGIAMVLLYWVVPTTQSRHWHRDSEPELKALKQLVVNPELLKLNAGIFILHAIFTASFLVIPLSFKQFSGFNANDQWIIYLPTLLIAFLFSLIVIRQAEKKHFIKPYFLSGIGLLAIAELLLWIMPHHFLFALLGLGLFFIGFSLLESFLPSLISRTAPANKKGTALSLYSCAQFSGIFVGGVLGGGLFSHFGLNSVYLFCILFSLCWLALTHNMQTPQHFITEKLRLPAQSPHFDKIAAELSHIPGIIEATFIAEDGIAYLKMEKKAVNHPDFIRLKAQLKS